MNENELKMFPVRQDDEVYQVKRDIPEPLQKPKKEPAPKFEKRITIFYWD